MSAQAAQEIFNIYLSPVLENRTRGYGLERSNNFPTWDITDMLQNFLGDPHKIWKVI